MPFVGKAKLWLGIAGVLVLLSLLVPLVAGFNFGIAFRGGSQFQVDNVTDTSAAKGESIVTDVVPDSEPRLTPTGDTGVRIETNQLTDPQMQEVRDALASGYS
ncbi:protein translocase subunit SecF, partial [Burkholderia multivorans]